MTSLATSCQSTKNSDAVGLRNANRAVLTGRSVSAKRSLKKASPSLFAARRSARALTTKAGVFTSRSRICCTFGRTRSCGARPPEVTTDAVAEALRVGYRHVDTAAAYLNEREVGEGIRRASIARDQVFIETKIWISDYGSDATLHAFDKSANKLGVDQLDLLLLLHQPLASRFDLTLDAYLALEQLRADGKVRAIGVSNFMPEHLDRLLAETSVVPAVNQLEVHPYFQQTDLQRVHSEHSIVTQAWSPIGGSPPTAASTRPPTTTRRCSRSHASTAGPPRR